MGYEVDVEVDGKVDVPHVFFRECRQVDVYSWHIDALVGAKVCLVLHLCNDGRSVDANHFHAQCAIVEENLVALVDVVGKIGVGEVYDVVFGVHFRTSEYLHHVAYLVVYWRTTASGPYFRSLGVDKYSDVVGNLSCVLYYLPYALWSGMGSVHSYNVHACLEKVVYELYATSAVADGCYNLSLFHDYMCLSCLQQQYLNTVAKLQ